MLSSNFMPHGMCFLWQPSLIWLHFISDMISCLGYYFLAGAIIYFTRGRKDLPKKTVLLLVGAFSIFLFCGTTHLFAGITIWYPMYWIEGINKAINAGISVYVFYFLLMPLIPIALDAPSPAQLEQANAQLNAKINELKQTRHELVQSEKMASLGRLVAGFAHELNTPIGVAVGTASTLQNKTKLINKLLEQEEVDEEELLAALETVDEASELTLSNLRRASHLVNSFKRTAVDQTSEDVRKFDIKLTVEDVINTLHNKFKRTDIKIQLDCPDKLNIYSIPGSLEQILTNLIMNSWIHGFDEGKNSGNIAIAIQLVEDCLKINYSDTGKGISSEALEKVFEPFFTTNRAGGGSGLGMYICYNLVTAQLEGNMTCESTVGEGVNFNLDFPVKV